MVVTNFKMITASHIINKQMGKIFLKEYLSW